MSLRGRGLALVILGALTLPSCSSNKSSSPPATAPATPLSVSSRTPAKNATGVAAITSVSATFSSALDASTVTTSSFSLAAGGAVPGRVSVNGATATFTPDQPLGLNVAYTATLSTSIKSSDGRSLSGNDAWTFTTQAGTAVGGIINAPTTWTLANSPYAITSDVQIAANVTLTLEPGVLVEAGNIKVFGTLDAEGTSGARITFKDVAILPGSNSLAPFFTMTIKFATFYGGTLYMATGQVGPGTLTLQDSRLLGLGQYLYLVYPDADCTIERNLFISSGGISVGISNGIHVLVENNVFYKQTTDFAIENWAAITNATMTVEKNTFMSTDRVALRLPAGYAGAHMDGASNYWTSTDLLVIPTMIFDKNDDLSCADVINFTPILLAPDAATPDPTPFIP